MNLSHLKQLDEQLTNYYHQYKSNLCNDINELSPEEILKCESRPILTCFLIISIIMLILLRLSSPYIRNWLSSREQLKQQQLEDEEVGLLETTTE